MNLKDLIESDASDILLNEDEMADSIQFIDQHGAVSTITAVVEWMQSRMEQRANHRVRIEPVQVAASATAFGSLDEGAAVRVDQGEPFDFLDLVDRTPGLVTAIFERTVILETGSQTGDL